MDIFLSRRFSWIALLALGVAGCATEGRKEYFLNPDGSGKLAFQYTAPLDLLYEEGERLDPDKAARDRAREIVEESNGFESWKDVQWRVNSKGLIVVRGTAYFRNLNAVEVSGDGLHPSLKENTAARMVLVFEDPEEEGEEDEEKEPAGKKLADKTAEEREREILATKMRWQQARGFVRASIADVELETIMHVPGAVENAPTFERVNRFPETTHLPKKIIEIAERLCVEKLPDGRSVRQTFKGNDLVALMDAIAAEEKLWRQALQNEQAPGAQKAATLLLLQTCLLDFSESDIVVRKDGKPLFDYEKELAAAKAGLADLKKRLGVTKPGPLGKAAEDDKQKAKDAED